MVEAENKKIAYTVLLVLLLIAIIGGTTYAALSFNTTGSNNTIQTGQISMSYTEPTNAMVLENALPKSDTEGKEQNDYFSLISPLINTDYSPPIHQTTSSKYFFEYSKIPSYWCDTAIISVISVTSPYQVY